MQTHFKSYLFAGCTAIILLLGSCSSKTNKEGKFIPKEASVVMHINGESLSSKLPWNEIKKDDLFKEAYSDSAIRDFAKKILDNPENSGIDIKKDIIIFGIKDAEGAYFCVQAAVKDASKIDEFNTKIIEDATKSEEAGIKYLSNEDVAVGRNNEKVIYVINTPDFGHYRYDDYKKGKNTKARNISVTCKSVFAIKEDNSLGKDENFSDLMQQKGDIHFWINTESLYDDLSTIPSMNKLYAGTRTAATLNFENGKISVDAKYYASKELADIYKKYEGSGISEDMLKRIAAKDVAALLIMNYKPEAIKEIIEISGFGEILKAGIDFIGFSIDDFIKANKGDAVFALTDIKEKVHSYPSYGDSSKTESYTTHDPEMLFAVSIADKEKFNLIVKGIKKLSDKKGKSEFEESFHYTSNDKYFVIGNNKDNVDKYLTNSDSKFGFIQKLSGSNIAGYADIQFMMKKFESEVSKDSTERAIYDLSLKMWKDAYLTGGKYKGGGMNQKFEINLMDNNTNSLKQLNSYFTNIAKLIKERDRKREERWKAMESMRDTIPSGDQTIEVMPVPEAPVKPADRK